MEQILFVAIAICFQKKQKNIHFGNSIWFTCASEHKCDLYEYITFLIASNQCECLYIYLYSLVLSVPPGFLSKFYFRFLTQVENVFEFLFEIES